MVIGIDANWAVYEKAGVGKYTYNLIKALLAQKQPHQYVLFFNFFRKFRERRHFIEEMVAEAQVPVKIVVSKVPAAWKEWLLYQPIPAKWFYREKVDLFHSPFFAGVPTKPFCPTVVTLHDMVFVHFPEHRGRKLSQYYLKRTQLAAKNSEKIIAVSRSTRDDLVKFLPDIHTKINIVYEGADEIFSVIKNKTKLATVLSRYQMEQGKYILAVCTLEPRKNLVRLVRAYALLPNTLRQKYSLVLVGKSGWNNQELNQTIRDLNLTDKVKMTGFVQDQDLPYFYNGAAVFAYPSLYEGFGLPPLEAMSCGAPVLTSKVSSLTEVVEDAALTVDPYNEEEIARHLKSILTSSKIAQSLREKGLAQAKKFSWDKAAKETIKVYNSFNKIKG